MNVRPLLGGIASYIPWLYKVYKIFSGNRGEATSARYCYSVWLRHLVMAYNNGLSTQPNTIVELGPGKSFGAGLAALISGANKYYATDVVELADNQRDVEIFDDLVDLFKKRADIPDDSEFPKVAPYLESYKFPRHILTDKRLDESLKQDRIESIRSALLNLDGGGENNIQISYFVPWPDPKAIEEGSVDMVYSQSVLEYIDNLPDVLRLLYRWLKLGGFMSHEIDLSSLGTAREWNGHWAYSDFTWRLVKGRKPITISRRPHSAYIDLLRKLNFEIVCDVRIKDNSGIQRKHLAPRFKNISDDDLTTRSAFIQAVKKP